MRYQSCMRALARIASGDYDEDDEITCMIDVLFLIQEKDYHVYTEAEETQIAAYRREVKDLLYRELGVSEEELTALYEACCVEDEYGAYLHYDTARKKVRQYVKDRVK